MAVVERLGGCCHGGWGCLCPCDREKKARRCVVREKGKSGIKTVTEVLLPPRVFIQLEGPAFRFADFAVCGRAGLR